jgi:radical SAM superfamily enzyme YgiQ (UPF0313 family)
MSAAWDPERRLPICLTCSHGGHLTEMLLLAEAFAGHDTFYFTYDADTTRRLPNAHLVPNMARNPVEFLKNLGRVWRLFREKRPGLVVSTGAEIAIPVVLVAKLMRIPTVYVECGAQATHPSVTGRLMYWLADQFLVQWPELLRVYGPRASFRGSLIDMDAPFREDRSAERRMRVTLVQPAHQSGFSSDQPPMGLGYIASVLQQRGCVVRLLDANVEGLDALDTARLIVQQDPDLVGITVTTPLAPGALDIVRAVRRAREKPPLFVAGGPHPTVLPDELVARDAFDYAVRAEGEETMGELVEALQAGSSVGDIEGLSWWDGVTETVRHNPARELCQDLAALPYPDWSLFPLRRYSSLARRNDFCLPITTSRGCPYQCTFCYKGVYGNQLRMREPEDVADEWQFLVERYGAQEIAVLDDNFTMWEDRAEAICELLIARGLDRVPWSTTNGIRVDHAPPRVLELMKRAGCYRVYFGIESGVQRVLDLLEKRIDLDQVRAAVDAAKAAGLEVGGYFMIGNVGESLEDMDATIRFALDLDLDIVQFTIATPYPGTKMYEQVVRDGELLIDSWEDLASYGAPVFKMADLAPEDVARKYREGLRRFYFSPRFIVSQFRQMFTWTGFKHRVLGALLLLKMTLGGRRAPAGGKAGEARRPKPDRG